MSFVVTGSERVQILSVEHLVPIGIAVALTVLLIRYASSQSIKRQQQLIHSIAVFISSFVIIFHVYHMVFDVYDFRTDLPLYLCSLLAVLIPIFTYYRKYWMFEVLVFWIIAGTIQGVITPDIAVGFPSFDYFRYWIVHLGLLLVIFYAVFVFKLKPKFKSIFKSFVALQGYVVCMMLLNYCLDANYFYLNEKPESASILDYFGEWPYYIIICQVLIIPVFYLVYLPFHFRRKHNG